MARTRDMTTGRPVRLILGFALPVLAGNLLQQLYSLIDSLIIGRLLGVTALAAVSASGWPRAIPSRRRIAMARGTAKA